MSVEEPPEYSISEFLLGSLFFAAAVSALIWAVHGYFTGRYFDAMKGAGLALILFAGCTDPLSYFGNYISFPYRIVDSAGRDTSITMLAAALGSILFTAGLLLNWFAET